MNEAGAHYDRAYALWTAGHAAEALAAIDLAIALKPGFAEAHYNRGAMLQALNRAADALAAFDRALAINSGLAPAWNNRGGALSALGRHAEAAANYDRLIALSPRNASAHYNRGTALQQLGDWQAAAESFARALALRPDHADAFGGLAGAALNLCDFRKVAALTPRLEQMVRHNRGLVAPLVLLGYSGDPALQRLCSEHYLAASLPPGLAKLPAREPLKKDRLRIAYLSADFQDHATAYLAAELFERHDRARFETIALSFGPGGDGPMRARIAAAFGRFYDIAAMSDLDAARLLHTLEADIAIDLKGHTHGARPAILAQRPCPVQAAWLGFPGSMGGDFIDYILADSIVAPADHAPFFSEKIVHLPGCYQVNDSKRPHPPAPPRAALGLPDGALVFCSFNNSWKIAQPIFDIWMRLLAAVPGSVLWLLSDNDGARRNLCLEAEARGVVSSRLIFAPRLPFADHLARYAAADLFLDTLPCNAHTTASDALWMGLPLVTCEGASFSGRVAASLLHAVGLPELVTRYLTDYENLALALAQDPVRLAALRARLAAAHAAPLFNSDHFRRNLEAAYEKMWDLAASGAPARAF